MGFRDLLSFNLAMLGKQIWRIIQFPDSLLSRVFKAKYFPNCDVLDAKPKSSSSFTWKSIFSAMTLVQQGVRWRVGSGQNNNIWSDNWLPREFGFRPFTPDLYDFGPLYVSSLIDQSCGSWDVNVVSELFWDEDKETILRIPLAGPY